MICPTCHNVISGQAKFCSECGANLTAASRQSAVEAPGPIEAGEMSLGGRRTMLQRGEASEPVPTASIPLGERYEILGEIGRGGFAVVHKARDRKLDRIVAIKRLLEDQIHSKQAAQVIERFRREAQNIAKLNHRNIVGIYDHDSDDEGYYIVMEYVEGGSLRDYLKAHGKKVPVDWAIRIIKGVALGLAYAHRKNLIHRDIKPANILLARVQDDEGGGQETFIPKIVDFGLARVGAESELSMTGYGMGSPYYMSPEQRRDAKSVNHTSDIYALGKTLYEMVTGEIPDSVDPEAIPPPPELARLIIKSIKPNPEDRYFSADDFLADVAVLDGKGARRHSGGVKHSTEGNACPGCGVENEKEARFCQGCGSGLYRACPECGREMRVQVQFCVQCGTDANAFTKAQDILDRCQRYRDEKKFSRLLKEAESFAAAGFVPHGAKASSLVAELQAIRVAAQSAETSKAGLATRIRSAMEQQDYDAVESLLRAYEEVSAGLDAEFQTLRNRLPVVRQIRIMNQHARDLEGAIKAGNWNSARGLLALAPARPDAVTEEDKAAVQKALDRLEELRREMSGCLLRGTLQSLSEAETSVMAAVNRSEWNQAWQRLKSIPGNPEGLLADDVREADAARTKVQELARVVIEEWVEDVEKRVRQAASDGNHGLARSHASAIDSLPVDPAMRQMHRQRLDAMILQSEVQQLRYRLQTQVEMKRWMEVRGIAETLLGLVADDAEALKAKGLAESSLRILAILAHVMQSRKQGRFKAARQECETLIAEVGEGFSVEQEAFKGSLGDLLADLSGREAAQAALARNMQRAILDKAWVDALAISQELLKDYPWMDEARQAQGQASREIARRHKRKMMALAAGAVAAAILVYVVADGIQYFQAKRSFDAAVHAALFDEALLRGEAIRDRCRAVGQLRAALEARTGCEEARRSALGSNGAKWTASGWDRAEAKSRTAGDDLVAGNFESAMAGYADATQDYRAAGQWAVAFTQHTINYHAARKSFADALAAQDTGRVARFKGNMAAVQLLAIAAEGLADKPVDGRLTYERARRQLQEAVGTADQVEKALRADKEQARLRYETAWKAFSEKDRHVMLRFGGKAWDAIDANLAIGQREDVDPELGCKAYERARADLPAAMKTAALEAERVKAEAGVKYKLAMETAALRLKEAREASPAARGGARIPTKEGRAAINDCFAALDGFEKSGSLEFITGQESALFKDCLGEARLLRDEVYAGPVSGEAWSIPGTRMSFVWVPALLGWVGACEVSNDEYRECDARHDSGAFKGVSLNADRQPVVKVNALEAGQYAVWLTGREHDQRRLPRGFAYRLPTSQEWDVLARCGGSRAFPWGNEWPPASGNYADRAAATAFGQGGIQEYDDQSPASCVVEKSGTNEWGICGMGGNVREWCGSSGNGVVVRGASWRSSMKSELQTDWFFSLDPSRRKDDVGFRLVLTREGVDTGEGTRTMQARAH